MSFSFDAPETVSGGGGFLNEPGTFHMVINNLVEGEGPKGTPIDGITVTFEVLAGTAQGQENKIKQDSLFKPSLQDLAREEKDGTACMARKKLAAFFIATNLLDPANLGKPVEINTSEAIARQLIVKYGWKMEKDGNDKYTVQTDKLEISYSDIFHVDDPQVKDIPKNAEALALIPKEHRHSADWFGWKKKKPGQVKPQMAAASVSDDDLF